MKKIMLAAIAVAFAAPAFAQMPPYAQLDKNTDGMVSMEEAKAAMPAMTEDQFMKADADGDKMLSEAEVTKMEGK
jgi:hypothetical protein